MISNLVINIHPQLCLGLCVTYIFIYFKEIAIPMDQEKTTDSPATLIARHYTSGAKVRICV